MKTLFLILLILLSQFSFAQKKERIAIDKDSTPVVTKKAIFNKYDSATKAHPPRAATFRSAVLPGWGQIYNKNPASRLPPKSCTRSRMPAMP